MASASRLLDELVARSDAVRAANVGLTDAQTALERATRTARQAEVTLGDTRERRARAVQRRDDLARRREAWASELASLPEAPADVRARLLAGFAAQTGDPDAAARLIRADLDRDQGRVIKRLVNAEQRAASVMQAYKYDWPGPAADLIAQADNLPDFLAILDGLQSDRLPEFEDRFFDLLQGQSRNNIGALSQRLKNARREVRERVDPINRSLRQTEYSPGRYLHVRVDDRRLPDVTTFLQTLTEITSGSLEDALGSALGPEARVAAEARFVTMERLLQRLASAAPEDVRWRQQCLDTRQHVQFVAEVRDDDGRAVDYFTSAGGLSGGERQKLVTFCLAAALRYQLAREGADLPAYGLVVLDEAFDKTDPAFTRAGLDVFRTFGFQLVLATPLKMLQTLEDYVGGAAVVLNESGQGSRLEVMLFEADADAEPPVPLEQETLL